MRRHSALASSTFILILALAVSESASGEQLLPKGWRRPTTKEFDDEWRRKDPSKFLRARGDFDGDGREDVVELLVQRQGNSAGLFVWRAVNPVPLLLVKFEKKELKLQGTAVVEPGEYRTACGKGYGEWACAHGEPEVLKLKHQAIDLFYEGSAVSIFYWDAARKAFIEVQMSD